MKKFMICVLSFVLVLSMAACSGKKETPADTTVPETAEEGFVGWDPATWGPALDTEEGTAQIPNPWQECSTLEEAGKLAGVSFTAPETVEGFDEKYIAAIPGDVAEVIFSSREDENGEVMFRKGTGDGDISGDYNTYDGVDDQQIDGKTVTVRSSNGIVYTVTWVQDGCTYAISARAGASMEQMAEWIQALA